MIRKRGNAWQVDFRHGDERVRKGGFNAEHEAIQWEGEAKRKLSLGLPIEEVAQAAADQWTIEKLVTTVEQRFWSGTSNGAEAVRLAHKAAEFFGPTNHPRVISSARVDDYVVSLKKAGNSPATVNRKLAAVSKLLTYAKSRGILEQAPEIERETESEGRVRWYTKTEEQAILAALPDRSRPFVVFLLDTGGRLGEALAVQLREVANGAVSFCRTKNGRVRSVPMTGRLRTLVDPIVHKRGEQDPTGRLWEGLAEDLVRDDWQAARIKCGLEKDPHAVLHTCRHTCASRLVQAGVPIQVVKEWLGHRNIAVTLRYAHLSPTNISQALQALEKMVA